MERINTRPAIIVLLMLIIIWVGMCKLKHYGPEQIKEEYDTTLIEKLREDKLQLQQELQVRTEKFEHASDSLLSLVESNKKNLGAYRLKSKVLEERLRQVVQVADTSSACPDSLGIITGEYIEAHNEQDSICTETISELEATVCIKDSVIETQRNIEKGYQDVLELERLHSQSVNLQLDLQTEQTRKATRQNKWLRGGLWLMSGVSATLLLMQAKK